MCLNRYVVTCSFSAWSPGDRQFPERQVSISPGPKDLFTDENDIVGTFVKFLQNGRWHEANRNEFVRSTTRLAALTARHGA
jgi:hypothetical protein